MKRRIAIIGGGASGMMAAITAAKQGAEVTIYEHMRLGKKILATGNGKCNLSNLYMTKDCFYSHDMKRLEKCLNRFGTEETIAFFEKQGLCIKERNGYLYPLAEQAAVVLQVLENCVKRAGISVIYEAKVEDVQPITKARPGRRVLVKIEASKDFYDAVIIACGSKAAPKTGSDGSGYTFAKQLGHKLVPVLPSLVQLRCSDSFCKAIAGIRSDALIHIYADGKLLCEEQGELQLTDYGISGIPVFQLSGSVNRYLYANKKATLVAKINFLPQMNEQEFQSFVQKRMKLAKEERIVEEFFCGVLNQKLMQLFIKLVGLKPDMPVSKTDKTKLRQVFELCRGFEMHITESNGFENAQVCTGGVDLREVTDDLESVYAPNVYFAGEILDVDGRCGGYNLQWAWTSGHIAGLAAASEK
ncbi:MAG: NAD(P)/FAD-dependent oxidoreductase [Lachnospiraceae bacterium]|nr:NAD(P)/FAD-dependent oxidoreductase [Lachnospiraceae bacterium]